MSETPGHLYRRMRQAANLSAREAASRAGLSASFVCDFEYDRRRTSNPETLIRMARAIGMNPITLLVYVRDEWAAPINEAIRNL
jgi:transcriptional regulator with XRE-family HTH domain